MWRRQSAAALSLADPTVYMYDFEQLENKMRPREQLAGLSLPGGWTVRTLLSKKSATGGNFSIGYLVENDDGRKGFLKAMDYVEAFSHPDTPSELKRMAEMYIFEKSICAACADLSRVVHAIEHGSILPDPNQPMGKVEYLIFELADGDVRGHLDATPDIGNGFVLRVLHNVAAGLQQMHSRSMAHQDLKPSNVLIFEEQIGSKIGDLGRAWAKAFPAPHDDYTVAGDRGYAPPELLYRAVPTDPSQRRFGCDLYHFGSLIVFVFTQVHINSLLWKHLAKDHQPYSWGGTYQEVLPYLQAAFGGALSDLLVTFPDDLRDDLVEMVGQLCEPDPDRRGHPLSRIGYVNRYSFERYISKLNELAYRRDG